MRRLLAFSTFAMFTVLFAPVAILPGFIAIPFGRVMGFLGYYLITRRREIAIDNVQAAIKRGALVTDLTPEQQAFFQQHASLLGQAG